MKTCFSAVASLLLCCPALCSDRIAVVDNSAEMEVKDAISAAVRAFDSEDVKSYEMCFKESRRPFVRKRAAFLFAEDKCSMEIVDMHVIEILDESASAAVKYRMSHSAQSHEILAEINLTKEGGRWVIDRESVRSKAPSGRPSYSGSGNLMAGRGGRAAGPNAPAGAWDPMNPDRDKISPHLHHLMGDIGIREGMGCANGKCANGRCPQ